MKLKGEVDKRPWGEFETFIKNTKCTVKILTIFPGKRFSLQYHNKRDEFWFFLEGVARVTIGNKVKMLRKGQTTFIPKKTKHRVEALSKQVRILEISTGTFSESDIIRLEDDFGRA